MMILVTNIAGITHHDHHDTIAKASRQAHRWLRRKLAQPGEWSTILDSATGELRRRYMLRNGRVERMS
jgi:hypothetical protein